jgi:uncharacterized membrane protein YkoI
MTIQEEPMTQRIALIIAGAMTTFVLVLIVGISASVAVKSLAPVQADAQTQPLAAPTQVSAPLAPDPAPIAVKLTPNQAAQIALRSTPRATLVRAPELVNFQGTVAYEVILNQGTVYVDANSGKILSAVANSSTASNPRGERRQESEHEEGDHD